MLFVMSGSRGQHCDELAAEYHKIYLRLNLFCALQLSFL